MTREKFYKTDRRARFVPSSKIKDAALAFPETEIRCPQNTAKLGKKPKTPFSNPHYSISGIAIFEFLLQKAATNRATSGTVHCVSISPGGMAATVRKI